MALQQQAYSVSDVASLLGLTRQTVHQVLKREELPSFRLGGKVLVPCEAVDKLLAGGVKDTAPKSGK